MPPVFRGLAQQGMTLPKRLALRDYLVDWYAGHGHDEETAMRAYYSAACASGGALRTCAAEEPGGLGCLHPCHDAAAPR